MRFFCLILVFAVVMFAVSCGVNNKDSTEILRDIMEDVDSLPAGKIYRAECEEGSGEYFTDSMRKAMYGEDSDRYFSLMEEYSIFVSSSGFPGEIAVFKCYSATDARLVEFMCRNRAELLRVALRSTAFSELAESISVLREGRYVVFVMADGYRGNPKKAVK